MDHWACTVQGLGRVSEGLMVATIGAERASKKEGKHKNYTILYFPVKGSSRRAEKSRNVLMMMMKAAKLGWAGPGAGQEQTMSRPAAGWE